MLISHFLIRPFILGPHLRPSSWVALLSAIRSLDHLCRLLYNHFLTSCRQHSSFTGWVMVVRRTQLAGWLLRSHDCFVSVVSRQRARVVFSSFAGSYFPLQLLSFHSFHPSPSCLIVQCTRVSFVSWFGHLGNISWVWSEPYFTSYHVSIFNLFSCHNVLRFIISLPVDQAFRCCFMF